MSEPVPAETQPESEGQAGPPRSAKKHLLTVAGLVGGALVGAFVLTPVLTAGGGDSAAHGAPSKKDSHGAPVGASGEVTQPHLIENIVVNPADSRGTRFVLLSVGIIMADPAADDEIRRRDAEARDRVVQVLGSKTIDELVDITRRDVIRRALAASIDSLVGAGKVRSVLFPQFVIQ
jgi:flagellar FliL protein